MTDTAVMEQRKVDRSIADTIQIGKGGINFQNAGEAMEFARLMSASGAMVPKHLRGQPGACLGVIGTAVRFDIDPFALAQKTYFVNDMIAFESAFFMAIINVHAPLKTRPDIRFEGEGPDRRCIVSGDFLKGGLREYKSPRFADIQPKNSPLWKNDPDQQMAYSSLRAFARRWCPEIIMGMYDIDEMREAAMVDVSPKDEDKPAAPRSLDDFAAAAEAGAVLQGRPSPEAPATFPPSTAGEGSGESPSPPQGEDPAAAAPSDSEARDHAIAEALRIATRGDLDVDGRLEELDLLRMDLADHLPGADSFIRTVLETAARVAEGKLKKDGAQKYLTGLKE
jgi:hypothetical protein